MHLLRNLFRYASKRDWSAIARDLKPVYTAPSEQAAMEAFLTFTETWEQRYPAIIKLWENAWPEFVPFLRFGACCVIDKWPSRLLSMKLSFRGRRANTARATKTARPQRPTSSLAAGGRQFCNRLLPGGVRQPIPCEAAKITWPGHRDRVPRFVRRGSSTDNRLGRLGV